MSGKARIAVLTVVGVVVLLIVAVLALPLFLNTSSFQQKIVRSASEALGRPVTVRNLRLSVLSGGLLAEGVTIADDPAFSTQPFVQAESVKVHVALWPLITRREVQVGGFVLDAPRVSLQRNAKGVWNYSSLGKTGAASTPSAERQSTFPDLTVGEIAINNGQVTVTEQPMPGDGTTAVATHVYEQVQLGLKDFSFVKSFPYTLSVHLPGEGTVSAKGTAGPVNAADTATTPFTLQLDAKHIDPLAAGLVDASSGISGQVDGLTVDASWSGQQMHVAKLLIDGPHVTVVQKPASKTTKEAKPEGQTTALQSLAIDSLELNNGSVTVTSPGQAQPTVYQNLHATLNNLTPTTASPFTASAQLPGGGTLQAKGTAGPFDTQNSAATPVDADVTVRHLDLQTSGLVAPDAGVGGVADAEAKLTSNGETLNANGTARVAGLRLAKTGTPSGTPVTLQFALAQNERALTGQVQKGVITIGQNVVNVTGTYQKSGPTTALDLKAIGQGLSINGLQAFLPSLGVKLPSGSRLEGGTLTANLTISGSTANPVISGPVSVNDTVLAGFDLNSKLGPVMQLTGAKPSNGTAIHSLSMDVRSQGDSLRTDKIALDVPALGTASGAGSVNNGALNYQVVLKPLLLSKGLGEAIPGGGSSGGSAGIAGQLMGLIPGGAGKALGGGSGLLKGGIPVAIGGTTTNPTFAPNMRGLATSVGAAAASQALSGRSERGAKQQADPAKQLQQTLGGLFGHK